jgi:hypothetical protein
MNISFELTEYLNQNESRHSREGGNPQAPRWIPAFAGMT